jgi:hypothetical protein
MWPYQLSHQDGNILTLIDASLVSNVGPITLSKMVGFAPIVVLRQEFR